MKKILFLVSLLPGVLFAEENIFANSHFTFGADFGYSSISENRSGSDNKDGFHSQVKLLATSYSDSNFFEIGVGYFFNEVKNNSFSIQTKSAMMESNFSYRFTNKFSMGIVANLYLGVDSSFSEFTYPESNEFLIGIGAEYIPDYERSKNKFRVNARVQKSLTIDDRDLYLATVGVSFSLPLFDPPQNKIIPTDKIIYKTKIMYLSKNALRATLDANTGLYFESGSVKENLNMLRYIQRLAYFLKKYDSEWKTIEINGHTDNVGPVAFNIELSRKRADTVKSLLVREGVDAKRIITRGHGPNQLKVKGDDAEARKQNRRVEIDFLELKNPEQFKASLDVIE